MYAVVRVNAWDAKKRVNAGKDIEEFDRIHADQPGFLGSLMVDLGDGRDAIVNLWKSEEQAIAALPVLGPAVARLLEPLMAEPSVLVGAGEVTQGAHLVRASHQ